MNVHGQPVSFIAVTMKTCRRALLVHPARSCSVVPCSIPVACPDCSLSRRESALTYPVPFFAAFFVSSAGSAGRGGPWGAHSLEMAMKVHRPSDPQPTHGWQAWTAPAPYTPKQQQGFALAYGLTRVGPCTLDQLRRAWFPHWTAYRAFPAYLAPLLAAQPLETNGRIRRGTPIDLPPLIAAHDLEVAQTARLVELLGDDYPLPPAWCPARVYTAHEEALPLLAPWTADPSLQPACTGSYGATLGRLRSLAETLRYSEVLVRLLGDLQGRRDVGGWQLGHMWDEDVTPAGVVVPLQRRGVHIAIWYAPPTHTFDWPHDSVPWLRPRAHDTLPPLAEDRRLWLTLPSSLAIRRRRQATAAAQVRATAIAPSRRDLLGRAAGTPRPAVQPLVVCETEADLWAAIEQWNDVWPAGPLRATTWARIWTSAEWTASQGIWRGWWVDQQGQTVDLWGVPQTRPRHIDLNRVPITILH